MTNEVTQALPMNPTPVQASQAPPTGETSAATVIVVIPTFNERENLGTCVPRVLALGPEYRVVIVDDNSPDGTGEIADALALGCPGRIGVVHRPRKGGLGPAYVAGFQVALAANPGFVATMDADLSHDPDDLPRLVAAAADHDLALGSRYARGGATRGWPRHRRLLSRFGGRYAAMVLGVAIADLTSGFKVFRAAALTALQPETMRADGYVFNIEITYRALQRGCSVIEVPIIFTDRVAGRSKLSRRIMAEAMIVVWRLRFARQREPITEEHHCRTHP